jgi:hypothetical protein
MLDVPMAATADDSEPLVLGFHHQSTSDVDDYVSSEEDDVDDDKEELTALVSEVNDCDGGGNDMTNNNNKKKKKKNFNCTDWFLKYPIRAVTDVEFVTEQIIEFDKLYKAGIAESKLDDNMHKKDVWNGQFQCGCKISHNFQKTLGFIR